MTGHILVEELLVVTAGRIGDKVGLYFHSNRDVVSFVATKEQILAMAAEIPRVIERMGVLEVQRQEAQKQYCG